jgi:hypothetical protein
MGVAATTACGVGLASARSTATGSAVASGSGVGEWTARVFSFHDELMWVNLLILARQREIMIRTGCGCGKWR